MRTETERQIEMCQQVNAIRLSLAAIRLIQADGVNRLEAMLERIAVALEKGG